MPLPCGQPASASLRLPVRAAAHAPFLRRFSFPSISAELISGRFPSSPLRASNPSGEQGIAVRSPGPARLRSFAFHFADSASAGSGRTRCVPAPSLRRPQPTFASFRSGSVVRPVPLRLGADPSPAQDQSPGSALSRTSFVASASHRSAPFQGTCLCYAPPPQAPAELHSGRFPFSPLRFSGCSPRLPRPPAAPCHFGVQPPQAPAEPLSCSLRPSGPHRRRLAFVPPPGNLPVHSRRQLAFRRLHSQPPSSAPWADCHSGSIPTRSDQPARPLPSSSGAPRAAQPSCGVRFRAD